MVRRAPVSGGGGGSADEEEEDDSPDIGDPTVTVGDEEEEDESILNSVQGGASETRDRVRDVVENPREAAQSAQEELTDVAAGESDVVEGTSTRARETVEDAAESAEENDAGRIDAGSVETERELTRQDFADADPRVDREDVELDRQGDQIDVQLRGDSRRRFQEGVSGGDARQSAGALGEFVSEQGAQITGVLGETAEQAAAPAEQVSETVDDAEGTLEDRSIEDDFEGPRSQVAQTQVGPTESRAAAQLAEDTGFSQDDIELTETGDGGVQARVSDEARAERLENEILAERDVLNEDDVDVRVDDDGQVVATAPPEFDSRFDTVERARIEYFQAGQSVQSAREDIVVGPLEDFESSGRVSREELAGAGAVATATPEPASTAAGIGVLGAVGAATALEGARQSAQQGEETRTLQEQSELEVVEDARPGQSELAVDESAIGDRISEFGVPDRLGQPDEIATPTDATVQEPEIAVGEETTQPGVLEANAIIDQPTSGGNDVLTPEEPTIDEPEPKVDETVPERNFPTGEGAVVGRTVEEVEEQPGELSEGTDEAVTESSVGVGVGVGLGNGVGVRGDELGATGPATGAEIGVDVAAGSAAGTGLGVGLGDVASSTANSTGSATGYGFARATAVNNQSRGRTGRPRLPRFGLDEGDGTLSGDGRDRSGRPGGDVPDGPLSAGWASETFEGFALGGFRETELAEGVDSPSPTGELPTATFADPTEDEAEALEAVGGVFGFSLDENDNDDGGGFF